MNSQVCHWSLWKLAYLNDLFLYGITVCFLISWFECIQNITVIRSLFLLKLLRRGKWCICIALLWSTCVWAALEHQRISRSEMKCARLQMMLVLPTSEPLLMETDKEYHLCDWCLMLRLTYDVRNNDSSKYTESSIFRLHSFRQRANISV
jgi:hypothetical protein